MIHGVAVFDLSSKGRVYLPSLNLCFKVVKNITCEFLLLNPHSIIKLIWSIISITVGGNILAMSMILAPASLPPVFHVVFTIPNVAINNSMACRVYRDIKFGHISSSGTTVQSTTLPSLVAKPHETIKLPAYRQRNGLETFELEIGGSGANTFNQASYVEGGVHITESVQHVSSEDNAKLKISLTHSTSQIDRQRLSVEI